MDHWSLCEDEDHYIPILKASMHVLICSIINLPSAGLSFTYGKDCDSMLDASPVYYAKQ